MNEMEGHMSTVLGLSLFIFENVEFGPLEEQLPEDALDALRVEVLRTKIRSAVLHALHSVGFEHLNEEVEFATLNRLRDYAAPSQSIDTASDEFQFGFS